MDIGKLQQRELWELYQLGYEHGRDYGRLQFQNEILPFLLEAKSLAKDGYVKPALFRLECVIQQIGKREGER